GSKLGLAVVNININYRRGAYVNEQLQIHSQFKKIGHRSAVMEQVVRLKDSDTVVADASISFVLIDIKTGKALTLDGYVAAALNRLLEPVA
ncbi:MAG: thioesterase, partial [Vitreoscilla sp.]|nr:thioesterase [Vitreoscilla sp.]MBP9540927.1 thioesterase [Vitreoscilla sp.]